MTLNKKITLILGISSLLLIVMFFGVTNFIVNYSFNSYMKENQVKRDVELVEYLEDVYELNGEFSEDVILNIYHQAMVKNYYITLLNKDKSIIWEMDQTSSGTMDGMMNGMMGNSSNTGNYFDNTYPINSEGNTIAYIIIGQYGAAQLSLEDTRFKTSLNNGLLITALVGLLLSIFSGTLLAKKFAKPIVQLKETTDILRQGNLQTRVTLISNTKEIDELKVSINHLASTLEEQEILRKRLTSDISHELRTPLNVLQNQFEALIDGLWEPTKERIQICNDEVHRLTNLVKDLEKLTTLDQAYIKLEKKLIHLKEIISPVIHQCEPSLQTKNIQIISNLEDNVQAWVDKDKMTQVMINLLSNAYKFTELGGDISIKLTQENKYAIINISDTGIGISKQDIKHIFERFYRAEQSRNRKTGGAGLGLSIVKGIIDAHGGQITVESNPNEGTTFIISIPID